MSLKREGECDYTSYPLCIPAVREFYGLEFHPAVTFIVGENGCGKSRTPICTGACAWPEAALSPTRQLAVLLRIHQLVEDNSQFIIATHSPILMAYPRAKLYGALRGDQGVPGQSGAHAE